LISTDIFFKETDMAKQDSVVIVGAARTPMGGFNGSLSSVSATDLGAFAIKEAVLRAGIDAADVEEVVMGNWQMPPVRRRSISFVVLE
jgi:acetyl-CoA acetyltransferase